MTTEIDQLLASKPLITSQTKKNYVNIYKKIHSILQQTISETDDEQILFVLDEISNSNVNNELTYINVVILIRQALNQKCTLLEKRRDYLKTLRDKETKKPKEIDLPPYNDVKAYIEELFQKGDYKRYIVNFLIFNYGVRNKDVNVLITTRKDVKNIDTNTNYLLVKQREIEWIRNEYKTVASHLQQRIVIKAKNFITAVKALELNTWLLSGTATPISETSVTNIITRMLFKHNGENLSESDYFKLNIKHLQTQPNSYSKIALLSAYRGTAMETIEKYYNLLKQ
jgi:hypothetical protein